MILRTSVNKVQVEIDLQGVTLADYAAAGTVLAVKLADVAVKNRQAICDAFLELLKRCPSANASDLWHHVVYRLYCETLPEHRPQNPNQSWVRASGDALEMAVERIYSATLAEHGVRIQALVSREEKSAALQEMGLGSEVGDSKLDVALRLDFGRGRWKIFGGVHVKASLAERVSDDVPASRSMMRKGLFSPLWTLDVKSFPPPHGDLVNRGELGTSKNPSEKRKYVEEHGEFDNCYSANSRTSPSGGVTTSTKRIFVLNLSVQPDEFANEVIARAKSWRSKQSAKR